MHLVRLLPILRDVDSFNYPFIHESITLLESLKAFRLLLDLEDPALVVDVVKGLLEVPQFVLPNSSSHCLFSEGNESSCTKIIVDILDDMMNQMDGIGEGFVDLLIHRLVTVCTPFSIPPFLSHVIFFLFFLFFFLFFRLNTPHLSFDFLSLYSKKQVQSFPNRSQLAAHPYSHCMPPCSFNPLPTHSPLFL